MGNSLSPCCLAGQSSQINLIFYGGSTQLIKPQAGRRRLAGEIMFQFPDCLVCHADSFFIGRPLPILSLEEELLPGQTYFVLPVDRLPCQDSALTAASFASLSPGPKKPCFSAGGQNNPFTYLKGSDGRTMIKVLPEFIEKVITSQDGEKRSVTEEREGLCSTPELKKHYAQLVGPKDQSWSPRLETIKERGDRLNRMMMISPSRLSPVRLFGLERK
ncbi:hypothetical protein LUZ60_014051 [Juncus effusus]|nr:hypothetical protein LUZ60_014051 [Juncus effusus]